MLKKFRSSIREKLDNGYRPIIGDVFSRPAAGKAGFIQMLQYYSECHTDEAIFESLRQWRRERSLKDGKSPFIVATNSLLQMIGCYLPHTVDELKQIPGMGKHRAELYAEDILGITSTVTRTTEFPLDWVTLQVDEADFEVWVMEQARKKEEQQLLRKENKKKLLEGILQGSELESLQQALSVRRRDLLFLVEELDREGYDIQPLIDTELKEMPGDRQAEALKAFEEKGDRYLKPVMQKVYPDAELSASDVNRAYEWLRLLRLKFRREKGLA
jgi:hypothetical protein